MFDDICHPDMRPQQAYRECPDIEQALSRAIIVGIDHTGSMGDLPGRILKKLRRLFSAAVKKEVIPNPQILFAGVGDAKSDKAPLQVGRFWPDIHKLENDLEKIVCEGCGGGSGEESYELLLYFAARRVTMDCLQKWKEKGFLFIIGDECPYPTVSFLELQDILGENSAPDMPVQKILAEVQEKYHTFFIIPQGHTYVAYDRWAHLLGKDHVIVLNDPDLLCETIVSTMALYEDYLDPDNYESSLIDLEVRGEDVQEVSQALVPVAQGEELRRRRNASATKGDLPTPTKNQSTIRRL